MGFEQRFVRGRCALWGVLLCALSSACGGDDAGDDGGGGQAGGGGGGSSSCGVAALGDPTLPIELEVTARGADLVSKKIDDGAQIPMILPPQGGRVMFIGARATNIEPCAVEINGTLRDLTNNEVRVDGRKMNLKPTGDGWGTSTDTDISTFSMIPTCPNQWAATDVFGTTFELELSLTAKNGQKASKKLTVVPVCGEPANEAECKCQCTKGYTLGKTCN
ncbi:MAG: hypothetical protein HYZ29_31605 [Myxococcales bacterium]|nr:hypothetical protein [Myxococcales bacterium]